MRRAVVMCAVALASFAGCSAEDPEPTVSAPVSATPEPTKTDEATSVDVEVEDGEVVGGMERVRVPRGNTVRLSVRSDVADEVHVHGYDESADVEAGGGILLTFTADVPGLFVVELEQRGLHIVELEVR